MLLCGEAPPLQPELPSARVSLLRLWDLMSRLLLVWKEGMMMFSACRGRQQAGPGPRDKEGPVEGEGERGGKEQPGEAGAAQEPLGGPSAQGRAHLTCLACPPPDRKK